MSSLSLNAVLAKAHAMYGRMLTPQNYMDLLACNNVGDVAAYLKTRTSYSDIFEGVATVTIPRGRLESLLKKRLFTQYASLCRYELSLGQDFYKYFIMNNDITQILNCLRLLGSGRSEESLFAVPAFFNERTPLDLYKLAGASSFSAMMAVLAGTEYAPLLAPFEKQPLSSRSILDMEAVLFRHFYTELWRLSNKSFKGKHLEGVLDVLRLRADMRTVVSLYRLKKMLSADELLLRSFTMPAISGFTEKQLSMLIAAPSAGDMLKSLEHTVYGQQLKALDYEYVEVATHKILFNQSKKLFRFSTNATVVMFCYIFLAENEIENITHIVEGIRYDVPPEKIQALLIGTHA
ncbi:MAG: V-type ATPase subunit [Clostridiales bacterium]|nr:V-type ATPase subunit [Clostridiales bacterium]